MGNCCLGSDPGLTLQCDLGLRPWGLGGWEVINPKSSAGGLNKRRDTPRELSTYFNFESIVTGKEAMLQICAQGGGDPTPIRESVTLQSRRCIHLNLKPSKLSAFIAIEQVSGMHAPAKVALPIDLPTSWPKELCLEGLTRWAGSSSIVWEFTHSGG